MTFLYVHTLPYFALIFGTSHLETFKDPLSLLPHPSSFLSWISPAFCLHGLCNSLPLFILFTSPKISSFHFKVPFLLSCPTHVCKHCASVHTQHSHIYAHIQTQTCPHTYRCTYTHMHSHCHIHICILTCTYTWAHTHVNSFQKHRFHLWATTCGVCFSELGFFCIRKWSQVSSASYFSCGNCQHHHNSVDLSENQLMAVE